MKGQMKKFCTSLLRSRAAQVNPTKRPEMPECADSAVEGKQLHEIIHERHLKYGPIFRDSSGPVQTVFTSSTSAIQQVFMHEAKYPRNFVPQPWLMYNDMRQRKRGLLFMNGQEWYHNRKILNKTMVNKSAASFMHRPCQEAAEALAENWKDCMIRNQSVPDLESQLYQWSIEVVLATMVGTSWTTYHQKIQAKLGNMSRVLSLIFDYTGELYLYPDSLIRQLPAWQSLVDAFDEALEAVDQIVEDMSLLQGAEDGLLRRMMDEGMGKSMLQRIVGDLIVAAGDTTAQAMQWLLYLLAKNTSCQEKLAVNLRGLDMDEVLHEPLLRGAIKESLRLYPIAPLLARIAPEDMVLDGYPVNKGEMVVLSFYTASRDEDNFPEPERFAPERWLKDADNKGVINPHASLPFAMGARSCVGKRLAEIQMSLTTAELLRHFSIDCENKDKIGIRLRMIPVPSEPLRLRLAPR